MATVEYLVGNFENFMLGAIVAGLVFILAMILVYIRYRSLMTVLIFSSILVGSALAFLFTFFMFSDQQLLGRTIVPDNAIVIGIWGSSFVVIVATMLNGVTQKYIVNPIVLASNFQRRVAQGEIMETPQFKHRGIGEIKTLVHTTETLMNRLREIVEQMQGTSVSLAEASEELAAGAEEVSATTEEVTGTIQSIAEGAAEQVKRLDEVNTILRELVRASEESILQINKASKLTQDIAEQTNLISLNAAIEAARAGDYGKGFGVVAENVRKLSVQSKQSANQIRKTILEVQTRLENTVKAIEDAMNQVASVAESTAAGAEEAAAASEEQASTMAEITNSAQSLAELAERSKVIAEQFVIKSE